MNQSLLTTDLGSIPLLFRGKVRDIYDLGDRLLLVATDRISAFDVVLPTPIPDKGAVLTRLSAFWFDLTRDIVPNHLISVDVDAFPAILQPYREQLGQRATLARRAERIDVECVVRGYLAGSAWSEYQKHGTVCGERRPAGMRESEQLPEPIFTPATKAATGHDENIGIARMRELVGSELTDQLIRASLAVYQFATEYARARGIIIADTKMEFGLTDDGLILIDELLTPDSSRFWAADTYRVGESQPSFDKQYVRDWLIASGWNKEPPAPALPDHVVAGTSAKYREAYQRLTGREW
jgi:phosphoribosylaminoimidazole-succinocarboxamide synthase